MKIVGFGEVGSLGYCPPGWEAVWGLVLDARDRLRGYRFPKRYSVQFQAREDGYDKADFQMVIFRGINRVVTCTDPEHAYGVLRMVVSEMEDECRLLQAKWQEDTARLNAAFDRAYKKVEKLKSNNPDRS